MAYVVVRPLESREGRNQLRQSAADVRLQLGALEQIENSSGYVRSITHLVNLVEAHLNDFDARFRVYVINILVIPEDSKQKVIVLLRKVGVGADQAKQVVEKLPATVNVKQKEVAAMLVSQLEALSCTVEVKPSIA